MPGQVRFAILPRSIRVVMVLATRSAPGGRGMIGDAIPCTRTQALLGEGLRWDALHGSCGPLADPFAPTRLVGQGDRWPLTSRYSPPILAAGAAEYLDHIKEKDR